ncbi:MAG TPA: hypothetical protein VN903_40560, partial [Polyangia bacterium]|nr:hypothetical protein [Polyangia bacterium]
MKRLLATLVLVAFGAAVGCGGGSGKKTDGGGAGGTGGTSVNANCSSFTACGGAIQGTWNYVSGCGSFSSATCPSEMTLTTLGSGAMAVYTFGAGGAFSYTASGSVNEMISY